MSQNCKWCGGEFDPETRLPDLAGPDGKQHPSEYCCDEHEDEAHDDA